MKLNALHLFLILLGSLLLCSILGNPMVEGMSGMSGRKRKQSVSIDDSTNFEDDDITFLTCSFSTSQYQLSRSCSLESSTDGFS